MTASALLTPNMYAMALPFTASDSTTMRDCPAHTGQRTAAIEQRRQQVHWDRYSECLRHELRLAACVLAQCIGL